MSVKFCSIPQKRLLQAITSASSTFYVNNILGFDGLTNVAVADLGTQHYIAFRNDTGTILELCEIDPSSISTGPITLVRRGLSFYGDRTTETTALKLDWPTNSIVMFGTDVPQIFQYLKEYIDAAAIAGAVPASTTAAGIVIEATQAEVDARTTTDGSYKLFPPLDKIRASKYHDYIADVGSTDAYAITIVPAITAYSAGQIFAFKAATVNTGACTLNVSGLGAKTIKKKVTTDLEDGDIKASQLVLVIYDGTNMQMLSPLSAVQSVSEVTSPTKQHFTSSGTWTKPAGLKYIIIKGVGGGGGGGGSSANNGASGAGGGGGEYFEKLILAAALGATETVTIGDGGTAGQATVNDAGTGGTTSFGSHATAIGGTGGVLGQVGGDGGAGGTGGTGGDIKIPGGVGGPSSFAVTYTPTGRGGNSILGEGGGCPSSAGTGQTGGLYGGGGGGGLRQTSSTAGSVGGKGVVFVYEFYI